MSRKSDVTLAPDQIDVIRERIAQGARHGAIAKEIGVLTYVVSTQVKRLGLSSQKTEKLRPDYHNALPAFDPHVLGILAQAGLPLIVPPGQCPR